MKLFKFLAGAALLAESGNAAPIDNGEAIVIMGQSSFRPEGAQLIAAVLKPATSKIVAEDTRYEYVDDLVFGRNNYHPVDMGPVTHDYMGKSVLAVAVGNLDIEMVAHLLKLKGQKIDNPESTIGDTVQIDLDQKDYWGNTALHLVATAPPKPLQYGDVATDWPLKRRWEHAHAIMKRLLSHGANPNAKNEYNMTPLMTASAIGFSPGVEELLKNGAEINYEVIAVPKKFNRYPGFTALDIAVQQQAYLKSIGRDTYYYEQTIAVLCQNGAHQAKTSPNACS